MDSVYKENKEFVDACFVSASFVFPRVLIAVIELDVFGIIAKVGPDAQLSATEIASQLPTSNPEAPSMLDRMLRLLASNSVLTFSLRTRGDGSVERLYGLTPLCKYFLGNENEGSLAYLTALNHHPAAQAVWSHLKDVILEGGDMFKKVHGMSFFDYSKKDPTFVHIFNKAMVGISSAIMKELLDKYKGFEGLESLVDVGGGTGRTLNMILSKYPSIKGINFDLPHVVKTAPHYPGIEHIGGDMFVSVPKGEAIIIKETCHNWDDESCVKLFKNCYEALTENGKVIIINVVIPEQPEPNTAAKSAIAFDNVMLSQLTGKERTPEEYGALCKKAGFSNFQVAYHQGIWAVMESSK